MQLSREETELRIKAIKRQLNELYPILEDLEMPWKEWKDAADKAAGLLREWEKLGHDWIIPF